jgi:long-subunit acyl-CoA synthetase (AMP-forming)
MALTVMQVLDRTANKFGDKAAMSVKRNGQWVKTTWSQYRATARRAARAFIQLGVEPKTGVSIIGYNCPEWFAADVGAILAGGFPAGIYTTNSAEQCQYIADHCEAAVVVVEDATQLAKFLEHPRPAPASSAIVQMEGDDPAEGVYSWEAFLALGDPVSEADLEARIAAQKPDDVCDAHLHLGHDRPAQGSDDQHDNMTWTALTAREGRRDRSRRVIGISYLPLSHIAEQVRSRSTGPWPWAPAPGSPRASRSCRRQPA